MIFGVLRAPACSESERLDSKKGLGLDERDSFPELVFEC